MSTIDRMLSECVHCGFCLQACPTYQLWGEEMDSPRGRIHLMRGLAEGDALDASRVHHFDTCLGCLSCMTACPSGVKYDKLIEATRGRIEREVSRGWRDRWLRALIFGVFPHPRRLRLLLPLVRLSQLLGLQTLASRLDRFPRLAAMASLAPRRWSWRPATGGPARGASRGKVAVLTGCVQSAFFSKVNIDTVAMLRAEGFDVVVPRGQGCCGALSLHSGREDEARRMAARLIRRIPSDVDAIISNAAGCGSSLKSYGELLAGDPRAGHFAAKVRDITEFLDEVGPVAPRHPLPIRVAYHDACHLAHGQGVRAQPRRLLETIPGLEIVEVPEGDLCCGSAGVYNILQPGPAADLGSRKARNAVETGAQVLVAGNPGCLMQVQKHLCSMPTMHTVELLASALDADRAAALLQANQASAG